jgi:transposase
MCRARAELVESRTKLINNVRGYLRTQRLTLRSGSAELFHRRAAKLLLERAEGLPCFIQRLLETIELLTKSIREADKELEKIADEDPTCRLLMTCPGVGVVTSVRFMSALDNVERFRNAHAVEAYLGLTPGENSSSERKQRLSITKAGPTDVRQLLVQACWVCWNYYPNEPITRWAQSVAARRGRPIAIVAMARKMAGILYAMWRDGRSYDAATPRSAAMS